MLRGHEECGHERLLHRRRPDDRHRQRRRHGQGLGRAGRGGRGRSCPLRPGSSPAVAVDPNGAQILIARRANIDQGTAVLWDPRTGERSERWRSPAGRRFRGLLRRRAPACDRRVDGTLSVWDPATGTRLSVLTGHTGPVTDVSFSARGRTGRSPRAATPPRSSGISTRIAWPRTSSAIAAGCRPRRSRRTSARS